MRPAVEEWHAAVGTAYGPILDERAIGGFLPVQVYYASPFQRPAESGTFGVVIAPGW